MRVVALTMPDYRQSQSSDPNSESSRPVPLPKPEDIVDPASPAPERSWGGIQMFSQLRNISLTERRYQLRRAGVIGLGFSIVGLGLLALVTLKSLVFDSTGGAAREFSGPFLIQVEAGSELNPFPGGVPTVRVSAVPSAAPGGASDKSESEITIFETTLLEPDRISELYAEFVSKQVAFVYFDTLLAVTTNGGHSWQVVTVYEELDEGNSAIWIDGVMLDETGHGFMFPLGVESLDSAWLTDDFGHSWRLPELPDDTVN